MDKMINLCGTLCVLCATLCNNLMTLRTTENPEGCGVKNAASIQKLFVHISINPYFLEAPLIARMFSKLLPYSLINKRIRGDGQVHHLLLSGLI